MPTFSTLQIDRDAQQPRIARLLISRSEKLNAINEDFISLWRSAKPTIAKVQGYVVAGDSDIALCCDLLVMADEARALVRQMELGDNMPEGG